MILASGFDGGPVGPGVLVAGASNALRSVTPPPGRTHGVERIILVALLLTNLDLTALPTLMTATPLLDLANCSCNLVLSNSLVDESARRARICSQRAWMASLEPSPLRTGRAHWPGGRNGSTSARVRSTTAEDENNQRNVQIDGDVPEEPPPPPKLPDEVMERENDPQSVKLEGERKPLASSDDALTSDEADTSAASGSV